MTKEEIVKHRGEFCFRDDCELDIVSWENGKKNTKRFAAGRYYWIDSIVNYADGYSDIKFYDGFTLHQIKLDELGYYLGRPEITDSSEIIPEVSNEPETEGEGNSESDKKKGWFGT